MHARSPPRPLVRTVIFLAYMLTVSISNLLTFPTYLQLGHFADRGEGF